MQPRIDHIKARESYQFESLGELGAYLKDTPATWSLRSSSASRDYDWALGVGYDGAVEMARMGWNEGAQKMQEVLKAFPAMSPQPDTKTDVYGFRPHVPRFCAGAPDSMIRHAPIAETGAGRVLTLVVPINANAHTSAKCMSNFGVAVAQYINQLETDGTRVELFACMANQFSRWHGTWSVRLKYADQPLDLAVVAFAIGHPAMFRRLFFACIERAQAPNQVGYGSSANTKLENLINPPLGTVILNGMINAGSLATTPAKALEYVTKVITDILKTQEL